MVAELAYYSESMNPISALLALLQNFSPAWISSVVDLWQSIQAYLKPTSPDGLFEILEYESTLELLDPQGRTARLKKRERIKFLQDNVIAFQDYAWGNGDVLRGYKCSPGIEADRYLEGGRWNILISLRETKQQGDVQDFFIERTLRNTFVKADSWWQIEMQHRTRSVRLQLIFPRQRACREAAVIERTRARTIPLQPKNFTVLPDGRQVLAWENIEPRRFETYTLKWKW